MPELRILKLVGSSLSSLASTLSKEAPNDGLLVAARNLGSLGSGSDSLLSPFQQSMQTLFAVDASSLKSPSLVADPQAPGGRLVVAPFGNIFGDYDDARSVFECGRALMRRAKAAGVKRPFVHVVNPLKDLTPEELSDKNVVDRIEAKTKESYGYVLESFFLGLLAEVYEPLQARESKGYSEWFEAIDIVAPVAEYEEVQRAMQVASAVDSGKVLAKDMGGADPERMSPQRFADHIVQDLQPLIKSGALKVHVESERKVLEREYPLLSAVARASYAVERHTPCVVRIEYRSPDQSQVKESLLFSGKGVTYDTGGLDIKFDGSMRGMSRDKCGASGVAGLFKVLGTLQPKHLNCTALLGVVRNSCGADGYVSDEVIVARSGKRVLIGNTDAEGRMVMTDLLCKLKEEALSASTTTYVNARLFTVATLTGHAVRAVGPYGITMDNGEAQRGKVSQRILTRSHLLADPFEVSTLRREDFAFVAPGSTSEDVVQANDKASSATCRGHQFPVAFMAIASGLADVPQVSYTHLDVAGSAEEMHGEGLSLAPVTGSPVGALTAAFVLV